MAERSVLGSWPFAKEKEAREKPGGRPRRTGPDDWTRAPSNHQRQTRARPHNERQQIQGQDFYPSVFLGSSILLDASRGALPDLGAALVALPLFCTSGLHAKTSPHASSLCLNSV